MYLVKKRPNSSKHVYKKIYIRQLTLLLYKIQGILTVNSIIVEDILQNLLLLNWEHIICMYVCPICLHFGLLIPTSQLDLIKVVSSASEKWKVWGPSAPILYVDSPFEMCIDQRVSFRRSIFVLSCNQLSSYLEHIVCWVPVLLARLARPPGPAIIDPRPAGPPLLSVLALELFACWVPAVSMALQHGQHHLFRTQ